MISRYEYQFMNLAMDIMKTGYEQKNERTGISTRRLSHGILQCDLEKEFPILTSKKTFWKSAVDEILWIYQKQSNVVADLKSHIWDEWKGEDGTIGKAYGYQVKQFSQVDYVLEQLRKDPSSRRAVMDLWQCADIPEMNLTPCVYTSVWDIVDGKLNVLVTSRSCDLLVGGVFNVLQYSVLCHLFARDLGVTPGLITFVAADVHIYENQFEGFTNWMQQYKQELACGRYIQIPMQVAEAQSRAVMAELEQLGNPAEDSEEYKQVIETYEKKVNEVIATKQKEFLEEVATEYRETANALIRMKTEELLSAYNEANGTEYTAETIPEELRESDSFKSELNSIEQDVMGKLEEMLRAIYSDEYKNAYNCKPVLVIDTDKTNFYDITLDDIRVENYSSLGKIELPVAV